MIQVIISILFHLDFVRNTLSHDQAEIPEFSAGQGLLYYRTINVFLKDLYLYLYVLILSQLIKLTTLNERLYRRIKFYQHITQLPKSGPTSGMLDVPANLYRASKNSRSI